MRENTIKIKNKKPAISTHLYVIRRGEYVKIGVTNNINNRLKTLQTASPEPIELLFIEERKNPTKAERYLHREFHKNRAKGEWFKGVSLREIRTKLMMFHDQD